MDGALVRIADTIAAEEAQRAWFGIDAPGAEPTLDSIHVALREAGLDVSVEDVGEWCQAMVITIASASNSLAVETRVVAAVAAGMILGAKLQETKGT
jgi:hypothetical protein